MPYIVENSILIKYTGNDTIINDIPESVTKIGSAAFAYCSSVTQITIPERVTVIGSSAFHLCASLTQITIPESVTNIRGAFNNCPSLTQFNIPKGVTNISGAFGSCTSLTQINIPEGVTEIGEGTFYCCTSLTHINILERVTVIGEYAFYNCTNLTQINIPKSVITIANNAFTGCSHLKRILVDNNNEVKRVKACLPDELKDKVTSYYLQHQNHLAAIIQSHVALYCARFNLFQSSLNDNVTGIIYQFLFIAETRSLSFICKRLKHINNIVLSIKAVHYQGTIPTLKPTSAVKTSFFQQYAPSVNDKALTPYVRSLNQYKRNIQRQVSLSLLNLKGSNLYPTENKSQSNNSNKKNNNTETLCPV